MFFLYLMLFILSANWYNKIILFDLLFIDFYFIVTRLYRINHIDSTRIYNNK
jgi:hypothetical protein